MTLEGDYLTIYFPTRFATLRERYDERVTEIGRAAIAAGKVYGDERMDAVYTAVRETLTNASLGSVGKSERRLREHFLDELEGLCLGSGLIDQSQKMTVAARAMADRKVIGHLSYRVATRRQSLRRPNMISIRLRRL